jgi:hypothetical protein
MGKISRYIWIRLLTGGDRQLVNGVKCSLQDSVALFMANNERS